MNEEERDKEIFNVFRKVAMNIPLIDVIKEVPKYVKFLKDLCTHKIRLKGNVRVNMGQNISAFIQPMHVPEKSKMAHNVSTLTQTMP